MTLNYQTIKALAKDQGMTIKDLCALAPNNDPFYTGRDSEVVAARWFADLWDRFGYGSGVHLRRMHYRTVSQDPPVKRPDGQTYENSLKDWQYLTNAGKWARYLGLVAPEAFVDRRNPDAQIFTQWQDPDNEWYDSPVPRFESRWDFDDEYLYTLSGLPELGWLPGYTPSLPDFQIGGYDTIEQGYHVEVWAEKTTMNDVLIPVCERYGVNLVTGAGEMSITSVVEFLQRVRKADRPARILYISDYDPAGLGMPISVARKIEFFQRNEGHHGLDIRLQPVVLSAAQVASFNLPRVPVKDSDKRKAGWEKDHGQGQVELDALEALYPGELERIVIESLLLYYDGTLRERAAERKQDFRDALQDARQDVIASYDSELGRIRAGYQELVDDFRQTRQAFTDAIQDFGPDLEDYQDRLGSILDNIREVYAQIRADLGQVEVYPDDYPLPEPDLPPESDAQLYDSRRDYFDQLQSYKIQRHNTNGKD